MTIHVQVENRKALVKAISEHLGQELHYDGPPSFNYSVGAITITRDCSLLGEAEDLEALMPFLKEHDYLAPECNEVTTEPQHTKAEPIQETTPGSAGIEVPEINPMKTEAVETESDPSIQITVSHTSADLTVTSLTNLIFMLYSKQYLLGKALERQTIHISDEVIQELQAQRPENMRLFEERIAEFRDQELIVGFDLKDDVVSLTFPYSEEAPARRMVYAQLLTRMLQRVAEATRVRPDLLIPEPEAEKYYMNGWLLRLGYGGKDSREQRRILMKNLRGYAAFKTTAGMDKHKKKYNALRKSARAAQKAVVKDASE